jgi:hypothetical protein
VYTLPIIDKQKTNTYLICNGRHESHIQKTISVYILSIMQTTSTHSWTGRQGMDGWMDGWMDAWMEGWMDGWWMDGWN